MGLSNREILLGVTGGIASYKSLEILRGFKKQNAKTSVIMTQSAMQFVQPLTFQTLSNRPVATSLFDPEQEDQIGHISLAENHDVILIAPATANIIAKMAHGIADDLLSTVLLASKSPVFIAPAMNSNMWDHPATQKNLQILQDRGVQIIPPESGFLACGFNSVGRLAEPEHIIQTISQFLLRKQEQPLKGFQVLVTAGPTQEKIDAVRYISNYSSGKMGYSFAKECQQLGAEVTIISGPVSIAPPNGVKVICVNSALEMYDAVFQHSNDSQLIIKTAAVADYRVEEISEHKQKKKEELHIKLIQNPDILKDLGKQKKEKQFLVGFAAESQDLIYYAKDKLERKNADFIIANNVAQVGAGFNVDTNIVTIVGRNSVEELPLLKKEEVAQQVIQKILNSQEWKKTFE
ncbi:MAG: phosphopantothenoylcysteine decarboxylase/phosphopantothenate--cysteine ligase [bacterium]|jgi:phosphopantothenoylcysteine decarboxylase/phosphopantothenate--cysteine ligase